VSASMPKAWCRERTGSGVDIAIAQAKVDGHYRAEL
jgi:hypothetical protein